MMWHIKVFLCLVLVLLGDCEAHVAFFESRKFVKKQLFLTKYMFSLLPGVSEIKCGCLADCNVACSHPIVVN